MSKKGIDLGLGHLSRVTHVVEIDESLDPKRIGLLSTTAVMTRPHGFSHLIQKLRLGTGRVWKRMGADQLCRRCLCVGFDNAW